MSYLLDTNACIRYLNSSNNPVFYRLNSLPPDDVFICDIVKFELYYGAYKSYNRYKNLATLKIFFDEFVSLPFDGQAADICGYIRSELNKKGTPIGVYDLQIASIALANNLVLVTHNVAEFSRVEGLQYEDWEVAV
ncbi:type II toxin-antitoxin system VapC family toxin [Nostoc sphaeroides CHAB 2801]|uniref:type II toxin-antitoxin system VapC family toxin n=1 Tax=Nostoc sphaeroides TaxID=446679 RepID=UPI001E2C5CA0|nr:type II toxin-antitoxin system VapC family toxin [Nostoc sphaeroides]MCC5634222.1 type II toxin-antitoxin system VapC family toxin [Nostoc sphaeroides CHAB 2801]